MKFIRKFTALALILTFIMNVNVMADNEVNYKNKGVVVKGNFAKDESKKQYSRVINSYTELKNLTMPKLVGKQTLLLRKKQ